MLFQGAYDIISWDPRGVGLFTLYVSSNSHDHPSHIAFT